MSQTSYFWSGTALGDAVEGPYTNTAFALLRKLLLSTDGGYVLPNEANYLNASTAGPSLVVTVDTGQAFVYGYYYKNTAAVALTLRAGNATYPRWDRVVLRVDETAQTVRLAVVEGLAAPVPEPPTLGVCDLEMPLYRVYIPAAAATISSDYIHDEREFADNVWHQNNATVQNDFLDPNWAGAWFYGTSRPATWYTGSLTYSVLEKPDSMTNGKTLVLEGASGSTMSTTFLTSVTATSPYTVRVQAHVTEGLLQVTVGAVVMSIPPTLEPLEIWVRGATTNYVTLTMAAAGGSNLYATIGYVTLAQGYIPAEPTWDHEQHVQISNCNFLPVASVTGASTSTTTVILTDLTDYTAGFIPDGVRAAYILLRARDSGSAASSAPRVTLQSVDYNATYLTAWCAGRANDDWEFAHGLIYLTENTFDTTDAFQVEVDIVASGAGTLDYDIYVVGVVT